MRPGHREAQNLFLSTGRRLGFHPKLTWTREYPTDGVWLTPERGPAVPHLPVVALEVVVFGVFAKVRKGRHLLERLLVPRRPRPNGVSHLGRGGRAAARDPAGRE